MSQIKWNVSRGEANLIVAIATRAVKLAKESDIELNLLHVAMNVTACHANGCPLRLQDLLEADDFNFIHDIVGIDNYIDRTTGKLTGFFEPRFAEVQGG